MQVGMEHANFGTWYLVQLIFNDNNYVHKEETMNKMIQRKGLTAEDLENDP